MSLCAQNWSLVMPNDTLVYEKQDNHQFFTVWVDSVHVSSTDTTYFMNRIAVGNRVGWDTIISSDCGYNINYPAERYLGNKAQFLGGSILLSNEKSILITDSNRVLIYPKSGVGSSWLADSIAGDSMAVIDVKWEYVAGIERYDSVKTFSYRNGVISVSKTHGVVSGFAIVAPLEQYKLIGVQNLKLGETIPMGLDLFDFEVGDLFSYKYFYVNGYDLQEYRAINRVTNKVVIGDTVKYKYGNNSFQYPDRIKGKNPFIEALPNTLAGIDTATCSIAFENLPYMVYVGRNSKGEIVKTNFYLLSTIVTPIR